MAKGRDDDRQEELEKEAGTSDSVRKRNRRERIKRRKQMDASDASLRENLNEFKLWLAVIEQDLSVVTKKWDQLMEKARQHVAIRDAQQLRGKRQRRGLKLSQRSIDRPADPQFPARLQEARSENQSLGGSENSPAIPDENHL